MALMASRGELLGIKVDFAIFADTQDESQKVYKWLEWLKGELNFPVYVVTKGKLSESALTMRRSEKGKFYPVTSVPLYVITGKGEKSIVTHRNCTSDYKIKPIVKELRKRCEIKRGQKDATVTSLIGISYDEMQRMKSSRDPWVVNRWPLVEMRMRRGDCIEWMRKNGYPEPPRSSCVYCPFHRNDEWNKLKTEEPEEFQKAVEFEKEFNEKRAVTGNTNMYFLSSQCKPLGQIDFRNDIEKGQQVFSFLDECDGMCGV
jgi:hypothetical protein